MTYPLPPVDAHAHIEPDVPAADLASLKAVVFAVTRSPKEWTAAAGRDDQLTTWGLGCHPGLVDEMGEFSAAQFSELVGSAAFVGEVGLDARGGSHMPSQKKVFDQVLEILLTHRRAVSIHSAGAAADVLNALERFPQPGAILHWWRGSERDTARAVEMGCFFSLNGAEARRPKVVDQLPPERVLTETDFPHTQRQDPVGSTPGTVETIECTLERVWTMDRWGVRQQIWSNLAVLLTRTQTTPLMPRGIRKALLVAHGPEEHGSLGLD